MLLLDVSGQVFLLLEPPEAEGAGGRMVVPWGRNLDRNLDVLSSLPLTNLTLRRFHLFQGGQFFSQLQTCATV